MTASTIPVRFILAMLTFASLSGCNPRPDLVAPIQPATPPSHSMSASAPASAATQPARATQSTQPGPELSAARAAVEDFFGGPFQAAYDVKFFPSRAALTEFARERWGMEKTECWMVAMGVSSLMVLLSPDVWKTEACEHVPTPQHIREIYTHELVHVFHGQHNPSHEFEGMEDAGWFVEGLAFHVAGQLTEQRLSRVRTAVAEGQSPARLSEAFSGQLRYDTSGSLVRFIEARWGRAMLKKLLPATTNAEILALLGISEEDFLSAWRKWVIDARA